MSVLLALVLAVPSPVSGWATYYDAPSGAFAAGPALRSALGSDWRGQTVTVCLAGSSRCVVGRTSDWCACGKRHGTDTVVDLPRVDFARLAELGRGVIAVTVRIGGGGPILTPPPTDGDVPMPVRPDGAMVPV